MQEPRQNAGAPTKCRSPDKMQEPRQFREPAGHDLFFCLCFGHLVNFGTPRGPPMTFFWGGNYTDFMCGLIIFLTIFSDFLSNSGLGPRDSGLGPRLRDLGLGTQASGLDSGLGTRDSAIGTWASGLKPRASCLGNGRNLSSG